MLILLLPCLAFAAGYREQLSGKRLTLEGTFCAGISLSQDKKNAYLYGERACDKTQALALRVRWLDDKTFILIEKNKPNDIAPPRTFLYRVHSIQGKKVKLVEIWTGWDDSPDETITYTLSKDTKTIMKNH